MIQAHDFSTFSRIFRANIQRRSRTAKGISETSTSHQKRRLKKRGIFLRWQVWRNTNRLIKAVWDNALPASFTREDVRRISELFYDIINNGLQNENVYRQEYKKLCIEAERLGRETGMPYHINRRYRTWDVPYSAWNLKPVELEIKMNLFYEALEQQIRIAKAGLLSRPQLLAYVDYMLDKAIHPWLDGCGRHATATVMWLSLIIVGRFPEFGERNEHYAAIQDLQTHIQYYQRCLTRI